MSYQKQNFVSGQVISAAHLNHMEDGIAEAQQMAEDKTSGLSAEIVRIKQAVQSNTNAITAEKTRATGEEAGLDKALTAEVDRAQKAEKELSDRIDDLPTGGSADLTIGTVTSGSEASASIADGKLDLVLPNGDIGAEEKSALLTVLRMLAADSEEATAAYNMLARLWGGETLPEVPQTTARLGLAALGRMSLGRS